MAEMLHGYHTNVKPIKEIIPVRKFVVGYTSDQTIVAAFPLDLLYWIEQADLGSEALAKLDLTGRPVKKTEIWITGTITPIAMKEFSARGLVVNERSGDVLLPQTEREELQEEEHRKKSSRKNNCRLTFLTHSHALSGNELKHKCKKIASR